MQQSIQYQYQVVVGYIPTIVCFNSEVTDLLNKGWQLACPLVVDSSDRRVYQPMTLGKTS